MSTTLYTQIPVGLVVWESGHDPEVDLGEGHLLVRAVTMQNVRSTVVSPTEPPKFHKLCFYLELMAMVMSAM